MDSTETKSENSPENGQAQTSEETKRAWDAERVASEFIVQLGRKVKQVAGKMREDSLHEALRATTNKVADKLDGAGAYLEERKLEKLVDDAVSVIRRYPVQSVLLGVTVGFFLARRSK